MKILLLSNLSHSPQSICYVIVVCNRTPIERCQFSFSSPHLPSSFSLPYKQLSATVRRIFRNVFCSNQAKKGGNVFVGTFLLCLFSPYTLPPRSFAFFLI